MYERSSCADGLSRPARRGIRYHAYQESGMHFTAMELRGLVPTDTAGRRPDRRAWRALQGSTPRQIATMASTLVTTRSVRRIGRRHVEQHGRHRPRRDQGRQQPCRESGPYGQHDAAENRPHHAWATCAERDSDPHLSRPFTNGERHDCIKPKRRQHQCRQAESSEDAGADARHEQLRVDVVVDVTSCMIGNLRVVITNDSSYRPDHV